ncbi:endonuclease YncB(thermonuclease family) [Limimaricola variabilis]|uniref:Endonuclease YncB(Thermonuclease family) n=1 Tax=Limimaricola variabilis TaxID=1492771 RepID=A0ABR6HNZ5_9RHOB|nr:thermonuclease family protein [Limimaricola variabilis]MBB3712136.1 endonuclease YncB(thermonuclease family) [Limimaricola variabilis]
MACFAIFAFLGLCSIEPAPAAGPSGIVAVIDGDTLDVGGARVRLHGVDAPENAQRCDTGSGAQWACGDWVTQEASLRFAGREARCETVDIDRYERIVARCAVDGADIGETLVSEGLALAYVEYSRAYEAQEAEARAARRGIWRGEVQAPWDWRRAKRAGQGIPDPAPERIEAGGCAIKGNISGGGRIYHMPGDPYYGRTKIDTGAGERWFCSEAEARRAGWRHAGS